MTGEQALKVISMLVIAYPQANIQEETVKLYAKFLHDLPFEAGKAAVLNIIAESKWFPTVSELRKAAVNAIPGNQIPTAADAWTEVMNQIRDVGSYGVPKFSHEVIEKSVRAIGWMNLCMSENIMADRAHFIKIYDTYRERAEQDVLYLQESRELVGGLAEKIQARKIQLDSSRENKAKLIDLSSALVKHIGG